MSDEDAQQPGGAGADVEIRIADPADVTALSGLATRFDAGAFGADEGFAQRATFATPTRSPASFRRALQEGTILVAVIDARLVGYAWFGPVSLPRVRAQSSDRCLNRIHVQTSLQGRGIGRRLMDAALASPQLAGARHLFLRVSEHNERALALYTALGFRRAGPAHFTGVIPGGDLVMVLARDWQPTISPSVAG